MVFYSFDALEIGLYSNVNNHFYFNTNISCNPLQSSMQSDEHQRCDLDNELIIDEGAKGTSVLLALYL